MLKNVKYARIIAVAAALLLWQTAAFLAKSDILIVSPINVLIRLASIWKEAGFWSSIGFSLSRIAAGFFTGFIVGIILAVLAGRFHIIEIILWPYMVTIKSVPVASFIIICLVFLNSSSLSIFISFLMVLPIIYQNVLQGIKSVDSNLLDMAKVFHVPWKRQFLYIYLPHLHPFLISACSIALGLAWKSGIAAEVIGLPDGSIGEMLYQSKIYLATRDLFAWTVIIVLISVIFEKCFLLLLRKILHMLEKK